MLKHNKYSRKLALQSYLMLTPTIIGTLMFVVFPLVWVLRYCMFRYNGFWKPDIHRDEQLYPGVFKRPEVLGIGRQFVYFHLRKTACGTADGASAGRFPGEKIPRFLFFQNFILSSRYAFRGHRRAAIWVFVRHERRRNQRLVQAVWDDVVSGKLGAGGVVFHEDIGDVRIDDRFPRGSTRA